jgi:phosphoserine phosphatase RsbU/P
MSNPRPRNILFLSVLLSLIGLVLYFQFMESVSPRTSAGLGLSRTDAIGHARGYLEELGFETDGLYADAIYIYNISLSIFLQQYMSLRDANRIMRQSDEPFYFWQVNVYDRSLPRGVAPQEFQVYILPNGDRAGYNRLLQPNAPGENLTEAQAGEIVSAYIDRHTVSLEGYQLQRSSANRLDNRTDWEFIWQKDEGTMGLEKTILIRLQGDEVGSAILRIQPPKAFMDEFYQEQTLFQFMTLLNYLFIFILFFLVVVTFLKRYHEGEVGVQTAVMVLIGVYIISILDHLNVFYYLGHDFGLGQMNRVNVRLVIFSISLLIIMPFFHVLTFAGWSVGESFSRTLWNEKLRGFDALLQRKIFTFPLGISLVRGYGFGMLGIGVSMFVLAFMLESFEFSALTINISGIPESFVPGLQPVLVALWVATMSEIVFRMFMISYLKGRLGKTWIGVVASVVLWTLAGMAVWSPVVSVVPGWFTIVLVACFGAWFAFLFLRYDLVTAITANFVTIALTLAMPLFVAEGRFYEVNAYLFAAFMVVPFVIGMVGVIRGKDFRYTPDTIPPHIKRISQRERMSKELEIARAVQMSLLPKETPHIEGFDIAGVCIPAQEVGGDYFDYVKIENGNLGIAIGDVSGKGVPAAIYMTLTKGVLQSHAESLISPKDVLIKVNYQLYGTIERNTFVSMVYAILDVEKKSMRYARAGHNPVMLAQLNSESIRSLLPKGIALGLDRGSVFTQSLEEHTIQLKSGDIVTFFTDGVTEARRSINSEFGEARFTDVIKRYRSQSSRTIIRQVVHEIRKFSGEYPQHDDMTIVIVKVK